MEQIKIGDIVRVSEDAPSLYTDGWRFDWRNSNSIVSIIEDNDAIVSPDDRGEEELAIPTKYLVKVNAEPKEKPNDGISEETANELSDKIEAYVKAMRNIADDFDWRRYEADLAKEIAVKIASPLSYNEKAVADYAVNVAKSVVENLKNREE